MTAYSPSAGAAADEVFGRSGGAIRRRARYRWWVTGVVVSWRQLRQRHADVVAPAASPYKELCNLFRWRARRAPRVRVLHGMGGAGKTTVALLVARALRSSTAGVVGVGRYRDDSANLHASTRA